MCTKSLEATERALNFPCHVWQSQVENNIIPLHNSITHFDGVMLIIMDAFCTNCTVYKLSYTFCDFIECTTSFCTIYKQQFCGQFINCVCKIYGLCRTVYKLCNYNNLQTAQQNLQTAHVRFKDCIVQIINLHLLHL